MPQIVSRDQLESLASGQIARVISTAPESAWKKSDPVPMCFYESQEGSRFTARDPSTGAKVVLTRTSGKGDHTWERFEGAVNGFEIDGDLAKAHFSRLDQSLSDRFFQRMHAATDIIGRILREPSFAETLNWRYRQGWKSERFDSAYAGYPITLRADYERTKIGGAGRWARSLYCFSPIAGPGRQGYAEHGELRAEKTQLFETLLAGLAPWQRWLHARRFE